MAIDSEKYSRKELQTILSEFKVDAKEYSFQSMTAGYINDTFLVLDAENPLFVLQRVNHSIFENIEGLMSNIDSALKTLKSPEYSKIKLVPASSGKTYLSHASGYWRVMSYLAQSTTYNTTKNKKIAFEAGRIIAEFQVLLADEPLTHYVDSIPKFHDLELREMQFLAALARASEQKKKIAANAISFSQDMPIKLAEINITKLPERVCHNDTKLNNILFSKVTQKALCLIDLDTLMKGYFLYDFGDAVRTIVNTAPEDEKMLDNITFNKYLFESFVDGLFSNSSFLNKDEIQTLHYGVILMPFLHGIRALTDYLNGNIYYKVAYENQNLDRCLSLFDFTKKAFANIDYMKEVLNEKSH
jgi:Ser/Thr protein kinase RdoA (MazF antagonist)